MSPPPRPAKIRVNGYRAGSEDWPRTPWVDHRGRGHCGVGYRQRDRDQAARQGRRAYPDGDPCLGRRQTGHCVQDAVLGIDIEGVKTLRHPAGFRAGQEAVDRLVVLCHDRNRSRGINNRQSTGHDATSVTRFRLTPIWQLVTLPAAPVYCRATPGDAVPHLSQPVSSTAHAAGPIASSIRDARRCPNHHTHQRPCPHRRRTDRPGDHPQHTAHPRRGRVHRPRPDRYQLCLPADPRRPRNL